MRKILVLAGDQMLTSGVIRLLSEELDLHLTSIPGDDEKILLETIEQLHPDVIVIEDNLKNNNLLKFLKPCHSDAPVRLVIINIEDNWIQVLQKQELLIRDQTDLVTAILK